MKKSILFIILLLLIAFDCAIARSLVFGGDRDYPPYEFIDENGNLSGFNIDLVRSIERITGLEISIELDDWNKIVQKLKDGKIAAIMGMAATPEREMLYSFSIPHNYLQMSVFHRKPDSFGTIEDLKDKAIIVQRNGVMHDYLIENAITENILLVDNPLEGLKTLASGKGDYGLFGKYQGLYFITQNRLSNLVVSDSAIFERDYSFAVSKEDASLLNALNKGLLLIRESGEYRELYKKWFGGLSWFEENMRNAVMWGFVAVALFTSALVGLSLWNSTLKKRVERRTNELAKKVAENESLRAKIRSLHEIAFLMEKCSSEEEVYDLIVKAAREILSFDYYSLDILEGELLVVKRDSQNIAVNSSYPKNDGVAGRTFVTGDTIVIDDVTSVADAKPSDSKIRSVLSIPIGSFGVFQTISFQPAAFKNDDVELAELLLYHAVGAIGSIRKTQEIRFIAFHDSLTGLYNRTFFDEEVSRMATSRNLPISIIFCDVNGLKNINDNFGHFFGDEYLKTVADIVKGSCRTEDLVVRWGGDEFVILLLKTPTVKAREIVCRIEEKLKQIDTFPVALSAAFGVATKTDENESISEILEEAEFEMYDHKKILKGSPDKV